MITMTPIQQRLEFRFSMFDGAMNTELMIFYLTMVHHYYGKTVMIIFDNLSSHISAQSILSVLFQIGSCLSICRHTRQN